MRCMPRSLTDCTMSFKAVGNWSPCTCYSLHTDNIQCGYSTSFLQNAMFTKMDNQKRELANKNENTGKKGEVVTL
jgi:hypothetical protein